MLVHMRAIVIGLASLLSAYGTTNANSLIIAPISQFGHAAHECRVQSLTRAGQPNAPKLGVPTALKLDLPNGNYWIELACREGYGEQVVEVNALTALKLFPVELLHFDHGPTLTIRLNTPLAANYVLAQLTGISHPSNTEVAYFDQDGTVHLGLAHSGVYTLMIVADDRPTCLVNVELVGGTRQWQLDLDACTLIPDHYAFVLTSNAADSDRELWEAAMVAEEKSFLAELEKVGSRQQAK